MQKVIVLGISTILTTSLAISASAAISHTNSHKEWAPPGMGLKVTDGHNKYVENLLARQKTQKRNFEPPESDQTIFLADFVIDSKGKTGELTDIESYVAAYISNNTGLPKTYHIETRACTDFIFSDNCAEITDFVFMEPNSEQLLSKKITIQYKFDTEGEHSPTTFTSITELKEPLNGLQGPYNFSSGNFGKLIIEQ